MISMEKELIDEGIREIMMADGPDGHTDGHEIITDFVMAILAGTGEQWLDKYRDKFRQELLDERD